MNACEKCRMVFLSKVDFHEHLSLECGGIIMPDYDAVTAVKFRVPNPIKLQAWKGPMDPSKKKVIVAIGEKRLGLRFFIGL